MADISVPIDFTGRRVLVAGAGTAGTSAARYLLDVGARVTLADRRFGAQDLTGAEPMGADPVSIDALLDDDSWLAAIDLVIVSPGFAPTHPLASRAVDAGIPVWGEVELAWQVDRAGLLGEPRTWLVVTGTNGKTTTTSMLTEIMTAAGAVAEACGNIGLPILDAMRATPRVEVLCVELSSFQLHWAPSIEPSAGVVLNIAEDHLDWHGSFEGYVAAKNIALHGAVGVVGLDDPVAASLPVTGRRVGFTLGEPAPGELGIVGRSPGAMIADRAFGAGADAVRIVEADGIHPVGPSGLADALAATALARAAGVDAAPIASALRAFRPAAHRGEVVAVGDGVIFVDDSKATNPHAAEAALRAHRRVVLVAGGLLKGAEIDGLVTRERDRLGAVVAIGTDRDLIVDAIARHAPEVPTVTVFTGDDGQVTVQPANPAAVGLLGDPAWTPPGAVDVSVDRRAVVVMDHAVSVAAHLAASTSVDAVLLAPAAASLDMFASYSARGDAFAAAARALPGAVEPEFAR